MTESWLEKGAFHEAGFSLVSELDKYITRKENYVQTNITYEDKPKSAQQNTSTLDPVMYP